MRTEISKLHNRLETTMIYVTHDQMEAMTMGDRIVVMKDGYVHQIDTPLNLYNHPINKFVAGFIGSPSMNFMNGIIRNETGLMFDEGKLQLNLPEKFRNQLSKYIDKQIIFGIRPEDIFLAGSALGIQSAAKAKSLLEVVEPMGNEIFLYLHSGSHQFVARVNANENPAVGSPIEIIFNMEKGHFFDPASEEHLYIK